MLLAVVFLAGGPQQSFAAHAPGAGLVVEPPGKPETGGPITASFPISLISNAAGHLGEVSASVAYNNIWDEYLVVWYQSDSFGNATIYGQFVNNSGVLIGGRFAMPSCSNNSGVPDVVFNPDTKEYLVVSEYGGTEKGICNTRLEQDGTLIDAAKSVVYSTTYSYRNPAVAYESETEQYLVVWEKYLDAAHTGIEAVSFTGDFTSSSVVIDITGMPADITPERPDVACVRPAETCLVVWHWWYSATHTDHEVYGQLIHMESGAHKQGGWIGIGTAVDDEAEVAVSSVARNTGIGQFLVVYERNQSGNWYTAGQTITDAGALDTWFPIGFSNGSAPGVAGSESTQEYLVAWPSAAGTALRAETVSTVGVISPIKPAPAYVAVPLYPAIASGAHGDYLVVDQDSYPGYLADIFGYLWGTRLYLPVAIKR
jgi:hypothetical protein